MNKWKLGLTIMGSIVIMVSTSFTYKLIGIACLIGAGVMNKQKTIIRRVK